MLLAFAVATLLAQGGLEEKVVAEFCDGTRAKGDLAALGALGEPGRLVLLELASSARIEAGCAFEHLANLDDRRVLPHLRASLEDEDALPPVRRQAVAFLGLFEDRESLDGILSLCRPGDYGMLVSCLSALGSIDDARAREALRADAADPAFEGVLPTVIRSIGRQADVEALSALDAIAADEAALTEPVSARRLYGAL